MQTQSKQVRYDFHFKKRKCIITREFDEEDVSASINSTYFSLNFCIKLVYKSEIFRFKEVIMQRQQYNKTTQNQGENQK